MLANDSCCFCAGEKYIERGHTVKFIRERAPTNTCFLTAQETNLTSTTFLDEEKLNPNEVDGKNAHRDRVDEQSLIHILMDHLGNLQKKPESDKLADPKH